MFVQIHLLRSLPPSNVNRDDTGQPKKCLFGGVTRGRISSQCLKRNIRHSQQFSEYLDGGAIRSRYLPQLLCEALKGEEGFDETEASVLAAVLAEQFKSDKKAASEAPADEKSADVDKVTKQLVFFTRAFVEDLAKILAGVREKEEVAPLNKAKKTKWYKGFFNSRQEEIARASEQLTPDIALFGRMTTSDLLTNVEAACQVAHAISTHETIIESDYFTAMDDLAAGPGAAFIGSSDTETFFNASVHYEYLNIDTDSLRDAKHLTESFTVPDTAELVGTFLDAAARTNPTGKQNAFAAHGVPELILVELSQTKQPISYANAFLQPVTGENLMAASADALSEYVASIAKAYAPADTKRFILQVGSATGAALDATPCETLDALIDAVKSALTAEA
ncbi:type I-E CRISPR-associated protein Cas7/Cse4/CasC [bacterium]|nr:type I-E CRISPR-associated protein Cas7/Cse4/CasC [bacterium]